MLPCIGFRSRGKFRKRYLQGIIVTKLDGTAKGGVICALSKALETPPETGTPAFKTFVYALGKGEGLSDLEPFNAEAYAKELVE